MKTVSPTGRMVGNSPRLQNIPVSTPESRRVVQAFRTATPREVKPSLKAS